MQTKTFNSDGELGFSVQLIEPPPKPEKLATVAVEALPHFEKEAEKRMLAGKKADPEANLPQGDRGPQARDKAAETVGVAARYVSDAKKIKAEAPRRVRRTKPTAQGQLEVFLHDPCAARYFGKGFAVKLAVLVWLVNGGNGSMAEVGKKNGASRSSICKQAARARAYFRLYPEVKRLTADKC